MICGAAACGYASGTAASGRAPTSACCSSSPARWSASSAAQDLLLFYAFFEAMLIPLYVLIGVWGGPGRLGATIKFIVYTVAGSLLMLAAIIVSASSRARST